MLSCLFIAALWPPAGKGLTSWLSCVWCFFCVFVTFPCWLYLFLVFTFLLTFVMVKFYLNPQYSKMLTTDDILQTFSEFEYNVFRWANKKLNEPKLLTWDVDFMVSEDFLIIFLRVYGSKSHRCGRGQFEPQGYRLQRASWIYVVNHCALLHTKYKNNWFHGSRRFFKVFPHYKEANNRPSWHGQVGPQGHGWHDLCRGPQDIAKLCASLKIFFKVFFSIISLWELLIARGGGGGQFAPKGLYWQGLGGGALDIASY